MMKVKKYFFTVFIGLSICILGCGVLFLREDNLKKYHIDKAQYEPYRLRNTIEGYREFIAQHPKNMFVKDARLSIEDLEFEPYKIEDSIEGYMEFKMRYPENRYCFKANVKIEQVEFKRYEKMDTVAAYREFIAKYPKSTFAVLAKERLQELQFRELDSTLGRHYGFDLLQYRLDLKRLKKKIHKINNFDPASFTLFSSIAHRDGKQYFQTSLIYSAEILSKELSSSEVSDTFFDCLLSKILIYLDREFTEKNKIDGFSFDISFSPDLFYADRKVLRKYYFPKNPVHLFALKKIDSDSLIAKSTVMDEQKLAAIEQPLSEQKGLSEENRLGGGKEPFLSQVKMGGTTIMTLVSERDAGRDWIYSACWERVEPSGRKDTMKAIEKKKIFEQGKKFVSKSILRYIDPPDKLGTSLLTWNYRRRGKAFWYRLLHKDGASRISTTDRIRVPAESDFCFSDYMGIKADEERHALLKSEQYHGRKCYVVESIPVKKYIRYTKRRSWIDQQRFIPLKIEYFDSGGKLAKLLTITWQQKFGIWFWKEAVVDNRKTGSKTTISIKDVRIDVGLQDSDFTKFKLEQKKMGF